MSAELLLPAIASGGLSGLALLLPTLAVALVYEHGRYVPLWVPDLGLGGAFLAHALWTAGVPGPIAIACALLGATVCAWIIHEGLIARFLQAGDYLSPLLIGLGLSQAFQGLASLYGHGMSQHYPKTAWGESAYSGTLGVSVYWVDVAILAITTVALLALHAFLRYTHLGLQVRAVVSNPDWARSLSMPVRTVGRIVIATAAVLVTIGTALRGIRFDLQPNMMFYPGLAAVAACIVATPGRRVTAMIVIVLVEIAGSLVGVFPTVSPLQRAVPFAMLVGVLVVRSLFRSFRQLPQAVAP